jgi:hypothetical protein
MIPREFCGKDRLSWDMLTDRQFFILASAGLVVTVILVMVLTPFILGGISWVWAATHPWYPCSGFGACAGLGGMGP